MTTSKNSTNFNYRVTHKSGECHARCGVFVTPHGEIQTPVFMPVGTQASVKGLSPEEVLEAGAEIMLSNTYHLFLRPGADLVAAAGGLHRFMNWNKPILTDSGGFQVFSLNTLRKISDNGVEFKSHLDGKAFIFTPELNMEIQNKLGADIIMQLDICCPYPTSKQDAKNADERTAKWLERCYAAHKKPDQALFPIVQGNMYPDLRLESLRKAVPYARHGIAIGGLAIGEPFEMYCEMLDVLSNHLPADIPHYVMGIGTPDYILEAVMRGIDMFDCVYQTRAARNGLAMTDNGTIMLRNAKFRDDFSPLQQGCKCYACRNFSKAYIRHLIMAKEMFGARLISIHNIHWTTEFVRKIRESIKNDKFFDFRREVYNNYFGKKID